MLTEQLTSRGSSRVELVRQLAARLDDEADNLATAIAAELGKPIRYARVEVRRTAELLDATLRRVLDQPECVPAGSARIRRRPLGTIAVITPANNPVYIPLGKICCALLYGNSAIWKPAPEAERVSRRLAEMLEETGCPPERFRMLTGGRAEAERLMNDPQVSAVTLTGSEATGRAAREICARRNIPLQAELGGNNAAIVWRDADLQAAARAVAAGAFQMAGQRCTANRRVIVIEEIRDQFWELLIEEAARLKWGDPLSNETEIGPLVSPARCVRVVSALDRAASVCERVVHPHGISPPKCDRFAGCWFPPSIVCCDDPSREIVQEETFGPVLVVQTARDWDDAIALCNGVRQGLAASVFTGSRDIVEQFLDQAQAGMLKIDRSTSDAEVDVPFCAWKASGFGPPKHGTFGRDFYTRPQTVYGAPEM